MATFRNGLMIGALSLVLSVLGTVAWAAAQKQAPAPPAPAREPAPVSEELITNEPHHAWWNTYHPGETYQAAPVLAAHRLFCQDHPSDGTCAGWDWH